MRSCEKMGPAPVPPTTNADFKGFGEARSGLFPIFSQPLREGLAAPARLIRQRPRSPFRPRLVRVRGAVIKLNSILSAHRFG